MKIKKWSAWPVYGKKEIKIVNKIIRSNQIFSKNEVILFEKDFSKYIGVKYSKCVGNATQGLHLSLAALGIGVGDEVIVTNFSWISTASCILMQNAVPVFCDIESKSLGIDPFEIEKKITKKTKAIIYVHMFGFIADVKKIIKISKQYKIPLIEDASHAHGSSFNKKKAGNFSDLAIFSLHQRKNLPSGEGGIITSNKKNLINKIHKLRSFGDKELSYNYRMTEFCAGIARVRLKKINYENKLRNLYANFIFKKCENIKGISFLKPRKNSFTNFHKLILIYNDKFLIKNIKFFITYMNKRNIPFERVYAPLNKHNHFNPTKNIKRGISWKWKLYTNKKIPLKMKKLNFPVTEEYSLKKLTQLDIHPPLPKILLINLTKEIKNYVMKYSK
jgi:perosamine synthetase